MRRLLVAIKARSRVKELEGIGAITYVSDYTNLIAIECPESNVQKLIEHPLVESYEEARTGSLQ